MLRLSQFKYQCSECQKIYNIKPEICNRLYITNLTRFKSDTLFRLSFHRSGATLSKSTSLIYCDLSLHYETYCIIQVLKLQIIY